MAEKCQISAPTPPAVDLRLWARGKIGEYLAQIRPRDHSVHLGEKLVPAFGLARTFKTFICETPLCIPDISGVLESIGRVVNHSLN